MGIDFTHGRIKPISAGMAAGRCREEKASLFLMPRIRSNRLLFASMAKFDNSSDLQALKGCESDVGLLLGRTLSLHGPRHWCA